MPASARKNGKAFQGAPTRRAGAGKREEEEWPEPPQSFSCNLETQGKEPVYWGLRNTNPVSSQASFTASPATTTKAKHNSIVVVIIREGLTKACVKHKKLETKIKVNFAVLRRDKRLQSLRICGYQDTKIGIYH